MEGPKTGVEFLAQLREKNGKQRQSFRDLFAYMEHKARQKGTGVFGQFELTPLCNLNCKMCYVHLIPDTPGILPRSKSHGSFLPATPGT